MPDIVGPFDPATDRDARAILDQLTLDEKIGIMSGDDTLANLASGASNDESDGRIWTAGTLPRLNIDGIRFCDGPRGVVLRGATTFPVAIARGAAWDPDLEERIGEAIGRELSALGANLSGAVCINLLRHPAWGRAQETFGEDPIHVGTLGAALTRGIQRHVMACVKHFALNSMENARFTIDVTVDDRTLHEIYLPHFKRVVDAGVAAVMTAYNAVNGEWCGQNHRLITEILKGDWGFDGVVMTDFLFGIRDARVAVNAGQDLEMPFRNLFHRDLKRFVDRGDVARERVDDAVLRILRQQIRFSAPPADPTVVGCLAHRNLAREAAEKSIVLLKNDANILPIKTTQRLAVIGRLAAMPNTGDDGSSKTRPVSVVTPIEGIRETFAGTVDYDDGTDLDRATLLARTADTVVCVVGYTTSSEGEYLPPDVGLLANLLPGAADGPAARAAAVDEAVRAGFTSSGAGDRTSLTLSPADEALIEVVAAANKRTIVVIMAGSAVIIERWRDRVPAILLLWYPGQEGGHALTGVLSGQVNPSGRLPFAVPCRPEDLPVFDINATAITYDSWHGYRKLNRDGVAPAFPFGFGLSYTTFTYSNLAVVHRPVNSAGTLGVTLEVTNTGSVPGDDVVQVYVGAPGQVVDRPLRELKAFLRVHLDPGETRRVRFDIPIIELAYYDYGWTIEPGRYTIEAGRHANDSAALRTTITLPGS